MLDPVVTVGVAEYVYRELPAADAIPVNPITDNRTTVDRMTFVLMFFIFFNFIFH